MNNISVCLPAGSAKIHVAFSDFSSDFDTKNCIFSDILKSRLGAEVTDDLSKADVLIHSVFGETHRSFRGTRIFYTGESVKPRWDECDYALSFLREEPAHPERHFRLPYWVLADYIRKTGRIEQYSTRPFDIMERQRKFCNFLYSNGNAKERVHFLRALSSYRHVDSAGRFLNNTGAVIKDKVAFCSGYKFTIAFENYPARGYVTEKLADAFAAGSLPIYWGAPDVELDFNSKRFVNVRDFKDFEELTEYIRYLDGNNEAYLEYFKGPLFLKGQKNADDYRDGLALFLKNALKGGVVRTPDEGSSLEVIGHYQRPDMPRFGDRKLWDKEISEPGTPTDALGPAPLRMAACLSSYKRVEDFIRQVLCLMNQSYPHVHVFAALKGVSRSVAEELVFPILQPFLDAGRLTLRLFPNKDQFSNFLDTVQGFDLSRYDLFAKIDDDDFYDRDYFQHVHDFHATLPAGYSSHHRAGGYVLKKADGFPSLRRTSILCTGAAQVMSRQVMMELVALNDSPDRMRKVLQEFRQQTGLGEIGFMEDQLFQFLMVKHGCGNIARYLEKQNIRRHIVIQSSNPSVMRGGSLSQGFKQCNRPAPSPPSSHEYVLDMIHPSWRSGLLIFNGKARRLDCEDANARVVLLSHEKVVLEWDDGKRESFVRVSEGVYQYRAEEKFKEAVVSCNQDKQGGEEKKAVSLKHPFWSDRFIIKGNRGRRESNGEYASVTQRDEFRLVLEWDRWDREEFVLRNDGYYHLSPYSFSEPDSQESQEWVIDVLDRPDKLWFHSMGRPTIHLRYLDWDMLALMERMKDDVLASLSRKPFIRRILVTGLCKNSLAALHLAMEIKRHFPQIETGVLGCPWTADLRSPQQRSGLHWPQSHLSQYQEGRFDALFERYGDPLDMWLRARRENLHVRGYSFHAENAAFSEDGVFADRLSAFLRLRFFMELDTQASIRDVHLQSVFFLQRNPEAFCRMIDLMFEDMRQTEANRECIRYRVKEEGMTEEDEKA